MKSRLGLPEPAARAGGGGGPAPSILGRPGPPSLLGHQQAFKADSYGNGRNGRGEVPPYEMGGYDKAEARYDPYTEEGYGEYSQRDTIGEEIDQFIESTYGPVRNFLIHARKILNSEKRHNPIARPPGMGRARPGLLSDHERPAPGRGRGGIPSLTSLPEPKSLLGRGGMARGAGGRGMPGRGGAWAPAGRGRGNAGETFAAQPAAEEGYQVFVYNIGKDADEPVLWRMFAPFGAVQKVDIINNRATGECRGYGFVTMTNYEEACASIEALNGKAYKDKFLQVKFKGAPRTKPYTDDKKMEGAAKK